MQNRSRTRFTRAARYGRPDAWYAPTETPSLATKLGKRITPQPDGCWYWDGYHLPSGYPMHGKSYVHRLIYEIVKGDSLPSNMHVHHMCEVKRCVNPAHLLAVPASSHRSAHATAQHEARRSRDDGQ